MAGFACIFYTIVIANHYYFRTYAFDYGVYNFAFWDYSHFHMNTIPCIQVFGNLKIKLIQGHFTLALMYLVPVYWLLNWLTGSYTLLIALVTCILWSGWATYKLIKLKTNDDWLAVISVLYYFLLQGRYASFGADFHEATFAFCFVPIFLLCFELRKYLAAFIIFILLLFSREDFPLCFIFIFIVLIIWHRKEKKIVKYCLAGILTSLLYFMLLFKVFIPMCETPDIHYTLFQYSALGNTPLEAFLHCIKHPIETCKLLYINPLADHTYDGVKKEFYMVYLISGGFLLFLRPQYFIWFIPVVAQKVFNDDPMRWGIMGYYCDPVITILPISIFMIVSIFKMKWLRYSLAILVCVLAFYVTRHKMDIHNRALIWGSTIKENIFDPKFFHPDYDAAKIHADLKLIPPDAKVCASESILPHLSQRMYAYEFPDVEDAEYLALFEFHNFYGIGEDAYLVQLSNYIFNPSWQIISDDFPFLLMKKNVSNPIKNYPIDSLECNADRISPDKLHFVASNGEFLENADTRDSSLKHNGNYSVRLNRNKTYGFTYHGINFEKGDFLKISVWKYPAINDTGNLVVSCGKDFYKTSSTGEKKDSAGWEQIIMYLFVPPDHNDFKVYVWDNGKRDIWFNDLKIVRRKLMQ